FEVGGFQSATVIPPEPLTKEDIEESWNRINDNFKELTADEIPPSLAGFDIAQMFEILVEKNLIQPTFITDFPKPISPLSKASPENPTIAERFELYVAGMEVANGFSELNDPEEQYNRFKEQME